MIKVVFVCLGNICRSPMAEVIFRSMVEMQGLSPLIQVDSAATSDWEEGNPIHPGTQAVLERVHLSGQGLISRPLNKEDLNASFIIGMDGQNMKDIKAFVGPEFKGQVAKLMYFTGDNQDIADPYYTGDFDRTFKDVFAGCQALMEFICEQDYMISHGLVNR